MKPSAYGLRGLASLITLLGPAGPGTDLASSPWLISPPNSKTILEQNGTIIFWMYMFPAPNIMRAWSRAPFTPYINILSQKITTEWFKPYT